MSETKSEESGVIALPAVSLVTSSVAEMDHMIKTNEKDEGWADPLQPVVANNRLSQEVDENSNSSSIRIVSESGESEQNEFLAKEEPAESSTPLDLISNLKMGIRNQTSFRPTPTTPTALEPKRQAQDLNCRQCGKIFAQRNPNLIFHQLVAHRAPVAEFDDELSPSNTISCPECSFALDVGANDFPNHQCHGRQGVALKICDKCGLASYNEDVFEDHRRRQHSLFDCCNCKVAVKSLEMLSKHRCSESTPQMLPCPLCPDQFGDKSSLIGHVTNYHRTDYSLFDKNGPYYVPVNSRHSFFKQNGQQPLNLQSLNLSRSASPDTSKEVEVTPEAEIVAPAKRKSLATRASAADKWRNVDGFNCNQCGATFLTSQSRAQHVRWRHPEIYAASLASPDKKQEAVEINLSTHNSNNNDTNNQVNHLSTNADTSVDNASLETTSTPPSNTTRSKPSDTFVCPVCSSSYISARSRAQHIRWSHPDVTMTELSLPNCETSSAAPVKTDDATSLNSSNLGLTTPSNIDEATLVANLNSGFKGNCEVCGCVLANAQGRAQHLRYKHPEAWALWRGVPNSTKSSPSTALDISAEAMAALQMSPSDIVESTSPEPPSENGTTYQCMFCEKAFNSKRGRGRHYYWTHPTQLREYTAKEFGRKIGNSNDTSLDAVSPQSFECPKCQKKFSRRVGLSIHMTQAHRKSEQLSQAAQLPSPPTPVELKRKKTSSSPSATARCLLCESGFAGQTEVFRHLFESHSISEPTDEHWVWAIVHADSEAEEEEEVDYDADMVRDLSAKNKTIPADLKCPNCTQNFPNELLFRAHMLLEHKINYNLTNPIQQSPPVEQQPRCEDCGKMFAHSRALHIHQHHTSHGPHRNKSLDSAGKNGSGVFNCLNCKTQPAFTNQNELQVHQQRKHKPYRCSKCSILMEGFDAFQAHQCDGTRKRQSATGGGDSDSHSQAKQANVADIQCGGCSRLFISIRALHIHQKMSNCRSISSTASATPTPSVSTESPVVQDIFRCDLCPEKFSKAQGLACHKRSKHNYQSMSPRSLAKRQKEGIPTLPANTCRRCRVQMKSRFVLAEHNNASNSSCGLDKIFKLRFYQGQVWKAIRSALVAGSTLAQDRKRLIEEWKKRAGIEIRPETPPPPPKQIKKKETPSPPRRLGKKQSPVLVSAGATTQRTVSKKKKTSQSNGSSVGNDQQIGSENKCSMCAREFPTPVQLMIHYCRDNCAAAAKVTNSNSALPTLPTYSTDLSPPPAHSMPISSINPTRKAARMKLPTSSVDDDDRPMPAFQ